MSQQYQDFVSKRGAINRARGCSIHICDVKVQIKDHPEALVIYPTHATGIAPYVVNSASLTLEFLCPHPVDKGEIVLKLSNSAYYFDMTGYNGIAVEMDIKDGINQAIEEGHPVTLLFIMDKETSGGNLLISIPLNIEGIALSKKMYDLSV